MRLDQINAQIIQEWHKGVGHISRGVSMARALITMLRMLFSDGLTRHEHSECTRLSLIMSKLEFEIPKSRRETLSEDLADAIRVEHPITRIADRSLWRWHFSSTLH